MRNLLELLFTLGLIIASIKLGWLWTILFVLLYILAFDLKLTKMSKTMNISSRFLAFAGMFLVVALTLRRVIGLLLQTDAVNAVIQSTGVLRFFMGSDPLKFFWSLLGAFAITGLVAVLILLVYAASAAPNMFAQYAGYKGHEWEAMRSAIGILLGINQGTWMVSEGKAEARSTAGGMLAMFGGPGLLIVQEGHVVVLEQGGKLTRVVGSGITWLKAFERVSMVVPLHIRSEKLTIDQVATRDRVIIEEFEIQVFHKVNPGPEADRIQDGQFSYNEDNIRQNVWNTAGADWRNSVASVANTATRDVVGRYTLDEILPMSDSFRADFRKTLTEQINKVTRDIMGILVTTVDIGRVKIPKEAEQRLLGKWLADWDVQIAHSQREALIRKGEAEAVILKLKEVAWAEAQRQLVEQMAASFRDLNLSGRDTASYLLSLRFLETLEKMASDPATKILLPGDSLSLIQRAKESIMGSTIAGTLAPPTTPT